MKYWQTALAILAALSASLALAEDFKTINGKEYKNVTVSRVEADGLILKSKSGLSKVYFSELPEEVVDKWIPPEQKQRIAAEKAAERKRIYEQIAAEQERAEKEKNAEADMQRSILQFQAAEQAASQAYQTARKGTVTGQVFVSTKGGENFKLGAVQVGLFAREAVDTLLVELKKYADIKIQQLRPSVDAAKAAYEQARAANHAAFDAASDKYFKADRELRYYYSGDFYFSYLRSQLHTAETDADGKFVIQVPQSGKFVIGAQAKRSVDDETESYYWLQPVALAGQKQFTQNLSNNNLTSTTGTSSLIHTTD